MGESIAHAVCWRLLGICCPIRSQAACHAPNLDPSTQVLINSYVREQMILNKDRGLRRGGDAVIGWKERLEWLWRNVAS